MKASDVMKRLSSGEMISILKEIYSEKLDEQILRYKDAIQSFIDYFGDQDIMIISVPSNVKLVAIIQITSVDVYLHLLFS